MSGTEENRSRYLLFSIALTYHIRRANRVHNESTEKSELSSKGRVICIVQGVECILFNYTCYSL